MERTQIYLPQSTLKLLRQVKRQRGMPIAQIIRVMLDQYLPQFAASEGNGGELLEMAKLELSGGDNDLSRRLDDYLYAKK